MVDLEVYFNNDSEFNVHWDSIKKGLDGESYE